MNFPKTRMRRLRYNKILRELVEDTRVVASDLIYPIFITEGSKIKEPINSMPGQYRYSIDESIMSEGAKASAPLFARINDCLANVSNDLSLCTSLSIIVPQCHPKSNS